MLKYINKILVISIVISISFLYYKINHQDILPGAWEIELNGITRINPIVMFKNNEIKISLPSKTGYHQTVIYRLEKDNISKDGRALATKVSSIGDVDYEIFHAIQSVQTIRIIKVSDSDIIISLFTKGELTWLPINKI
ncbi:hypothetical protein [Vibrio paucivorans]|uniref:Uncharacterized protein n=1 Tax=Vibrio paucivorans TaxID=2829489 RepID=A0A9X3CGT5_9VIBR|nr:hypothetical protein [Vibrio paucivorans]MCW8334445.1 hypothetical protein [Vibrio paucivorans]